MIPKRIFYVWYGPVPEKVERCIASWRSAMPDWEVIEVNNTSPWFDFHGELARSSWFRTVFEKRFWAYASDYIRVKTLLEHGGIYCDTDITALRPFDPLRRHTFFAGFESRDLINLSIFGCVPGHPLLQDIYNFYQDKIWHTPLYTIPQIATHLLVKKYGAILYDSREIPKITEVGPVTLYPERTFYPYRYDEQFDERCVNKETYTIHWWGNSWGRPELIRWLSAKHCTGILPTPEEAPAAAYLRHTPREVKLEVRFLGIPILKGFKQGCFHVYAVLGLPILAVEWLSKEPTYFLFARFRLFSGRKTR